MIVKKKLVFKFKRLNLKTFFKFVLICFFLGLFFVGGIFSHKSGVVQSYMATAKFLLIDSPRQLVTDFIYKTPLITLKSRNENLSNVLLKDYKVEKKIAVQGVLDNGLLVPLKLEGRTNNFGIDFISLTSSKLLRGPEKIKSHFYKASKVPSSYWLFLQLLKQRDIFVNDLRYVDIFVEKKGQRRFAEFFCVRKCVQKRLQKFFKSDGKILTLEEILNNAKYFNDSSFPPFEKKALANFLAINDVFGGYDFEQFRYKQFFYVEKENKIFPVELTPRKLKEIANPRDLFISNISKKNKYSKLLKDKSFLRLYVTALKNISELALNQELLGPKTAQKFKQIESILFSSQRNTGNKRYDFITSARSVKNYLQPGEHIYASVKNINKETIELFVGNIHEIPVEVTSLSINGKKVELNNKKLIEGKKYLSYVDYQIIVFPLSKLKQESIAFNPKKDKLSLQYLSFDGGAHSISVENYIDYIPIDFKKIPLRKKSNIDKFSFLNVDRQKRIISIKQGSWNINEDLIFPKGYLIKGESPLTLNLTQNASIVSLSPIVLEGGGRDKIYVTSKDESGQGVFVYNTNRFSKLQNVVFEKLKNPNKGGWGVTGAVSFYQAPVEIRNSTFKSNRSEDILNIIRTSFSIKDSYFEDVERDAIDCDFAKGEIRNTQFLRIGNDAIDVSGTEILAQDIDVAFVKDKAISVGEASKFELTNIRVKNASIAFASKDNSSLKIENADVENIELVYSVFQKKPEYGPASIEARNVRLANIFKDHLVDFNSTLVLDGIEVSDKVRDVEKFLYGNEFGKSSK